MNAKDFFKALQAIEQDKFLNKNIVIEALEEALLRAYRRNINVSDAMARVYIDDINGDIRIYRQRNIVEEVEDDELEYGLEEAREINKDYDIGDIFEEEVDIEEFGRLAAIQAKQVLRQKIREAEKQVVFDEYIDKKDDLVMGVVERVEEKYLIVNLTKTLAMMPKAAQIPNEKYYEGQRLQVVVTDVNKDSKGAQVLVSRATPIFVRRLFEKEVPEIFEGVVEIKNISREAGDRTKISVKSNKAEVDPIGSCVGPKGQRVQAIIDELHGEKIDIVEWSEDPVILVKNALAPCEIISVMVNEDKRSALAVVVDHQLSLAIGRKGQNARLAAILTNMRIDIKSKSDADKLGLHYELNINKQSEKTNDSKDNGPVIDVEDLMKTFASNEKPTTNSKVPVIEFVEDKKVEIKEELKDVQEVKEVVKPVEKVEKFKKTVETKEQKPEPKPARSKIKIPTTEYVSKFEVFADTSKKKVEANIKPKSKKRKDFDDEKFGIDFTDFGSKKVVDTKKPVEIIKPIYSDEELEEIEENFVETRYEDEVDYDEFDKYYDEE